MCQGDNYKFHAAGREDIDVFTFCFLDFKLNEYCADLWNLLQVRMLGSGRPFLLEVQKARQVPSEVIVKKIESKINGLENKLVSSDTIFILMCVCKHPFVYQMI